MARVTVEDCVVKVPNRFELVLLAAQRAREISSGAPLSIDRDDDKNPVVALDGGVGGLQRSYEHHLRRALRAHYGRRVRHDDSHRPRRGMHAKFGLSSR